MLLAERNSITFMIIFYLTSIPVVYSAPTGTSTDITDVVFEESEPPKVTTDSEPEADVTTEPDKSNHSQESPKLKVELEPAVNQPSTNEVTRELTTPRNFISEVTRAEPVHPSARNVSNEPVRDEIEAVTEDVSHQIQAQNVKKVEPVLDNTQVTESELVQNQSQVMKDEPIPRQSQDILDSKVVQNLTMEVKGEPVEDQTQEVTEGKPVEDQTQVTEGKPGEDQTQVTEGKPVEDQTQVTEGEPVHDLARATEGKLIEDQTQESEGEPVRYLTQETEGEPVQYLTHEVTGSHPVADTTQEVTEGELVEDQTQVTAGEPVRYLTQETEGEPVQYLTHEVTESHPVADTTQEVTEGELVEDQTQKLTESEPVHYSTQEVTEGQPIHDQTQMTEGEPVQISTHNPTKNKLVHGRPQEEDKPELVQNLTKKLKVESVHEQVTATKESDNRTEPANTEEPNANQTQNDPQSYLVQNSTEILKVEPDHDQVTERLKNPATEALQGTENSETQQSTTQQAGIYNEPVSQQNLETTETQNGNQTSNDIAESVHDETDEDVTNTASVHLQRKEDLVTDPETDPMQRTEPDSKNEASTTGISQLDSTTPDEPIESEVSYEANQPDFFRHAEASTEANDPISAIPDFGQQQPQKSNKILENFVTDHSTVLTSSEPVDDHTNTQPEEELVTKTFSKEIYGVNEAELTTMQGLSPRHLDDYDDIATKENWTPAASERAVDRNEVDDTYVSRKDSEPMAKLTDGFLATSTDSDIVNITKRDGEVTTELSSTEELTGLESRTAHIAGTELPASSETVPPDSDNVTELELTDRSIELAIHTVVKNLLSESTINSEDLSSTESSSLFYSERSAVSNTNEINEPTTNEVEMSTSGEVFFRNTPLEGLVNRTSITSLDLTTVASLLGTTTTQPPSVVDLDHYYPIRGGGNEKKAKCTHYGREYATGEHVEQQDPCHFCVCVNGYVDCYWKNCPPPPEGCIQLDFDGVCDRSLYLCPIPRRGEPLPFPVNSIPTIHRRSTSSDNLTCDILGVQYKVGELVGVASDPCMECRCALDSLYCSPKCCFQPSEPNVDLEKNSRSNDAIWQPVLANPLKHLRYEFERHYTERK